MSFYLSRYGKPSVTLVYVSHIGHVHIMGDQTAAVRVVAVGVEPVVH